MNTATQKSTVLKGPKPVLARALKNTSRVNQHPKPAPATPPKKS